MEAYLSPLCPINFADSEDTHNGELERVYIQQFVKGDCINLQLVGEYDITVYANIGSITVNSTIHPINDDVCAYNISIDTTLLDTFCLYNIEVHANKVEYRTFTAKTLIEIVDDCQNLKLIEYYDKQNITPFNTYFNSNGLDILRFYLRLPVGYKSTSYTEQIESETFRNQNQELKMLYAYPYRQKSLIIGCGLGVPTWVGRLLNYIFCLSNVSIEGERVVRSGDAVPERQDGLTDYPLHIYNMTVESYENIIYPQYDYKNGDYNNDFTNDFNR